MLFNFEVHCCRFWADAWIKHKLHLLGSFMGKISQFILTDVSATKYRLRLSLTSANTEVQEPSFVDKCTTLLYKRPGFPCSKILVLWLKHLVPMPLYLSSTMPMPSLNTAWGWSIWFFYPDYYLYSPSTSNGLQSIWKEGNTNVYNQRWETQADQSILHILILRLHVKRT